MSDERDTRVECLQSGDRFRWLQKWFTVRRLVDVLGEARVGVEVAELEDESRVTFLFPVGHFVAADLAVRAQ